MRTNATGNCEHCHADFQYFLVHNGFNDSAYAYCNTCGLISLLSGWYKNIPKNSGLKIHGCIAPEIEILLKPCTCGGHFKSRASPRCPSCREELSAEFATTYIEKNAPGTAKGWRWQRDWVGMYSIIINDRKTNDNWTGR